MIITRSRGDLSDAVDPLEGRAGVRGWGQVAEEQTVENIFLQSSLLPDDQTVENIFLQMIIPDDPTVENPLHRWRWVSRYATLRGMR